MTLGERCDEILRLIGETLDDLAGGSGDRLVSPAVEDFEVPTTPPAPSLVTS